MVHIKADEGFVLTNGYEFVKEVYAPDGQETAWVSAPDYLVPENGVARYSRWGIIKAIEKRGLADAFDEYLKSDNRAFRSFYGPEWFESTDERFVEMVKTIQQSFGLTDKQIAEILSESLYDEN